MPEDPSTPNSNSVPEQDAASPTSAPEMTSSPTVEQEPATTPSPSSETSFTPVAPVAKSNNKKKWIIGGVIAGILVLLGGGAAIAYTVYQSPEKVITDGITNTIKYGGNTAGTATINVKNKDVEATIDVTAMSKGTDSSGNVTVSIESKSSDQPIKFDASADVVMTKTTIYFKVNDAKKTADSLISTYIEQMAKQYQSEGYTLTQQEIDSAKTKMHDQVDPVVSRIDNRWIKADLTSSDSSSSKEQQCALDAVAKLQSDKEMQNEIKSAYQDNKFVVVKKNLGLKNGSYGYLIDFDYAKAKTFGESVKNSKFGKALSDCGMPLSSSTSTGDSEDTLKDSQVELWVSQWDHRITGLKFSGEDKSTADNPTSFNFDMTIDYKNVDKIDIPSSATDIKDIQSEIESLFYTTSSVV